MIRAGSCRALRRVDKYLWIGAMLSAQPVQAAKMRAFSSIQPAAY